MVRLAALVFRQEQREGTLRIAHARLRLQAQQVALWRGGACETVHLSLLLRAALANQQAIVLWDWLLAAATAALDYCGSLATYLAIALSVWSGGCVWPCARSAHVHALSECMQHCVNVRAFCG